MRQSSSTSKLMVLLLTAVLSTMGCARLGMTPADIEPTEADAAGVVEQPTDGAVAVAVAPTSGPGGTEIGVAVAGLPADVGIELRLGRPDAGYDVATSAHADNVGTLTASLVIPTTAEPGEEWVVAAISPEGTVWGLSGPFSVREAEYAPDAVVVPDEGPPGTPVQVIAHGFPAETAVEIGIGRVDSEYDVVTSAETDGAGRMVAEITIPEFVDPAHRWVIVAAVVDRPMIRAISEEFAVTEVATPTPVPTAVFTRTNVYLVAVGDDGQFGERFGCNDSLVKYEVAIEPTAAPLTAALEQLLSIDSRQVGEMELTNHPLYGSDLEVDSVEIRDGEAVIRLSGTLEIVGVCDEPRVWRQLSETALQFDTVEEVSILIDDTPLDELLMMDID